MHSPKEVMEQRQFSPTDLERHYDWFFDENLRVWYYTSEVGGNVNGVVMSDPRVVAFINVPIEHGWSLYPRACVRVSVLPVVFAPILDNDRLAVLPEATMLDYMKAAERALTNLPIVVE